MVMFYGSIFTVIGNPCHTGFWNTFFVYFLPDDQTEGPNMTIRPNNQLV